MALGLPGVNIVFQTKAAETNKQQQRGIVATVVRHASVTGVYECETIADVPNELSTENKAEISEIFMGGVSKVIVAVIAVEAELQTALSQLEAYDFDWFGMARS